MKRSYIVIVSLLISTIAQGKYSNESELTTLVSGGNTSAQIWNAKTLNSYEKEENTYSFGGHYTYGESNKSLTARNWDLNARYERELSKSWSSFGLIQYLEDVFANIDYKWNYDLGGAYYFIKTEKKKFHSELGIRRTIESDLHGLKKENSRIRGYLEFKNKHSASLSYSLWIEGIKSFEQSEDWEINIQPSLSFSLSDTLALKIAYLYEYDNEPALDTVKQDYKYTTSLIAKF